MTETRKNKNDTKLDELRIDDLDGATGGCAACGNPAHLRGQGAAQRGPQQRPF
jgi:hypothetical protein